MKILITGATGFIGSHLAARLASDSANELVFLVRKSSPAPALTFLSGLGRLVYGDLLDEKSLRTAVDGVGLVFHAGGGGRVGMAEDICVKINITGTENLLKACSQESRIEKLVYLSTCSVMGNIKNPPADETHEYNPEDIAYSRVKTATEALVLDYRDRLPVVAVRLPGVYGPPLIKVGADRIDGVTPFLMILKTLKEGQWRFIGDGNNLIHCVYIDNAIDGLLLAATAGTAGEAYILADAKALTFRELVGTAAATLDVPVPTRHISIPIARLTASALEIIAGISGGKPKISREMVAGFIANRSFDIGKARRELGYQPVTNFVDGLRKTVDWYEINGYL